MLVNRRGKFSFKDGINRRRELININIEEVASEITQSVYGVEDILDLDFDTQCKIETEARVRIEEKRSKMSEVLESKERTAIVKTLDEILVAGEDQQHDNRRKTWHVVQAQLIELRDLIKREILI